MIYSFLYRLVMRFAHKHNWHYAPPVYPDVDTQLWCQWCGFRQTIKRNTDQHARRNMTRYSEEKWETENRISHADAKRAMDEYLGIHNRENRIIKKKYILEKIKKLLKRDH